MGRGGDLPPVVPPLAKPAPGAPYTKAPLPDPSRSFAEQEPVVLLAMAVFGESRGVSMEAKLAVACVVRNRVNAGHFGSDYTGVLLKPYQFDCFDANDPNSGKLLRPLQYEDAVVWEACFTAAYLVHGGSAADTTNGALFYHSFPEATPPPAWGRVEQSTKPIPPFWFFRPC